MMKQMTKVCSYIVQHWPYLPILKLIIISVADRERERERERERKREINKSPCNGDRRNLNKCLSLSSSLPAIINVDLFRLSLRLSLSVDLCECLYSLSTVNEYAREKERSRMREWVGGSLIVRT